MPRTDSIVHRSRHVWHDEEWMDAGGRRSRTWDRC